MNPRDFINFFKTKSGKLVLFAVVFGAGLLLFSIVREKSGTRGEMDALITRSRTNQTDKPQVVHTVERPMQPFHPPKSVSSVYAPFGRLIPCETVITVDSASIQTPIVGFVTEDIYHAGRLVIPASTEVHGTAQTDRHRERIASGGSWTLVWQTGEELHLKAIALDREFSGDQEGWGITDGSAGLRGRVIKSDNLADIKLFAATFLSGAAGALTEKKETIFGPINSPSLNNAPFEGAQKVLSVYAQRIYEAIQRDGFYVRVPSGKQFYLYVLQTIDRAQAVIGGAAKPFAAEDKSKLTALQESALSAAPALTSESPKSSSTPLFQP